MQNPLAQPQRESAGASTTGKYSYQYHWALCEIIDKHKQQQDYAVLIEYHEDVVIADSLEAGKASFEFYQVKNQAARFTVDSVTKRKKGSNGVQKNSVLGKLLSSCSNPKYTDRITKIGLVSSSGFSFSLVDDLKLDVITVGDISEDNVKSLTEKVKSELDISLLPEHLHFIIPEIEINNQEDYVVSRFAYLINSIFPGGYSNPVDIYRAVIDEIGRLSRLEFDYNDWERLLEKKSLTSAEVQSVIALNSSYPGIDELKKEFDDVINGLGLDSRRKRSLKRDFSQIALSRAGFMSSLDIDIVNLLKESYKKVDSSKYLNDADHIDALLVQAKKDGLMSKLTSEDRLMVEVIYCLLKAE